MTSTSSSAPITFEDVMAILHDTPKRLQKDLAQQLAKGDPNDRDHAIWFLEKLFQLHLTSPNSPLIMKLTFGQDYDAEGKLTAAGQRCVQASMPYLTIEEAGQFTYQEKSEYLHFSLEQMAEYIAWRFRCAL